MATLATRRRGLARRRARRRRNGEARVQERKQKLLRRNLEFVFCLTISKSQGEARNLNSGRRYLGCWNLLNSPNPGRGAESGIWKA